MDIQEEVLDVSQESDERKTKDSHLPPLPIEVYFNIFFYLQPRDLGHMSCVNKEWKSMCSDDFLWKQMLERDIIHWHTIDHLTNPDAYCDGEEELPTKQIYLRCSPQTRYITCKNVTNYRFPQLLRSLIRPALLYHQPAKIVVFGPGLRKPANAVITNIFSDFSYPGKFKVMGFAPGEIRGIGSGVWVKVNDKFTINMILLYPGAKQVRDAAITNTHKLFEVTSTSGDADQSSSMLGKWSDEVEQLTKSVDGFLFVINGDVNNMQDEDNNMYARQQLFSMSRNSSRDKPFAILSCNPPTSKQTSSIDACRSLHLKEMANPWMCHKCLWTDGDGAYPAVDWLISRTTRSIYPW